MKSDFFIDRPVFSTVLSIVIVIVGAIGLTLLPVDQYPQIVPPVVKVSASYPGADAQTVTQAVATPIEQELNGTPGMIYMESSSSNSGGFTVTVTFDISTNADLAAVDIQNRIKEAEARLPAEVVQNGISVEKQASSKLLTITLLSSDPKFDEIYLSNYATLNVVDMLRRIPGVGRGAYGQGSAECPEGSEPRVGGRRAGPGSDGGRGHHDPDHGPGTSFVGEPVRGDRREGQSRRLDHPAARRGEHCPRGAVVQYRERHQRRQCRRAGHLHAARGECRRGGGCGAHDHGRDCPQLPRGHHLQRPLRHDDLHLRVDSPCLPDAVRGARPGDPRRLPLAAELAGDAHPDRCGAHLAHRYVRRDARLRLLAQPAHAARTDPRHRYCSG